VETLAHIMHCKWRNYHSVYTYQTSSICWCS